MDSNLLDNGYVWRNVLFVKTEQISVCCLYIGGSYTCVLQRGKSLRWENRDADLHPPHLAALRVALRVPEGRGVKWCWLTGSLITLFWWCQWWAGNPSSWLLKATEMYMSWHCSLSLLVILDFLQALLSLTAWSRLRLYVPHKGYFTWLSWTITCLYQDPYIKLYNWYNCHC